MAPTRRAGAHSTKRTLHALEVALCGQPVPQTLDSSKDRQRIVEIQRNQLDATWRQLRSRYPTTIMAARELHTATQHATQLVDDLLAAEEATRPVYGPVRAALIATITRRLIVDGIAIARSAVDSSRAAMKGLGGSGSGVGGAPAVEASIPGPRSSGSVARPGPVTPDGGARRY